MRLHLSRFCIILVALISLAVVPGDASAAKHDRSGLAKRGPEPVNTANRTSAAHRGPHHHKRATNNVKPTNQTAFRRSTSVTNTNPGNLGVGGNQSTAKSTRVVKKRYIDQAGRVRTKSVRVAD